MALQLLVVTTGFFIMLLVMSFNIWVFITIIIGLGVGKLITTLMPLPNLKEIGTLAGGNAVYNAAGD
jgi:hypothetical protein